MQRFPHVLQENDAVFKQILSACQIHIVKTSRFSLADKREAFEDLQ